MYAPAENVGVFASILRISASDRLPGSGSNTQFHQNLEYAYESVHAIEVVQVNFPNLVYNVPDGYNVFNWTNDIKVVAHSITIPPGQYNITSLLDILKQDAEISDARVNPVTGVVEIDFIESSTVTGVYAPVTRVNDVNYYLGFTSTVSGTSVTAPTYPHLQGLEHLSIRCPELSPNCFHNDYDRGTSQYHIITSVPITAIYGSLNTWEPGAPGQVFHHYSGPRNISRISLSLYDKWGRKINIKEADWTIIFKIYYSL